MREEQHDTQNDFDRTEHETADGPPVSRPRLDLERAEEPEATHRDRRHRHEGDERLPAHEILESEPGVQDERHDDREEPCCQAKAAPARQRAPIAHRTVRSPLSSRGR